MPPQMPQRPVAARPGAMPARPQIPAPAAVVPSQPAAPVEAVQTAPAVAAPVETAPAIAAAPVQAPTAPAIAAAPVQAPEVGAIAPVQTGTAPTAAPATAETPKAKRGRAARELSPYWGICVFDENGVAKMVLNADKTETPLKQKLDGPPVLFAGTEEEAKASDGQTDSGFNQEKHVALTRDDFKKGSDLERHRANLARQKAAWLDAEAAAIDAGKSTRGTKTGDKQNAEMKLALSNFFNEMVAQGLDKDLLLSKLGDAAKFLQGSAPAAAPTTAQ